MQVLKIGALMLVTVWVNASSAQSSSELSDSLPAVERLADGKLRYLEVSGNPYQRGFQHGAALKEDIHAMLELVKEDIRTTNKMDPDSFITAFLEYTDYEPALRKWTPDLLEELKGISAGAAISMQDLFMHQLGDEYWFNGHDLLMQHHCSSIGLDRTKDRATIGAQTIDIPPFYQGFQTVIRHIDPAQDQDFMVLVMPGHLGTTGLNHHQVSVNVNTLMQLNYATTGLPVTGVVRGVLACKTEQEALKFLEDIPHASGQNYIIGGRYAARSMECSANQVAEFRPFTGSVFTYHTNHPLSNSDYNDYYYAYTADHAEQFENGYPCERFPSLQKRFGRKTGEYSIDDVKQALRARDVEGPDVVSNNNTFAGVIYELTASPVFHIAPGKPHEEEFIQLTFDE